MNRCEAPAPRRECAAAIRREPSASACFDVTDLRSALLSGGLVTRPHGPASLQKTQAAGRQPGMADGGGLPGGSPVSPFRVNKEGSLEPWAPWEQGRLVSGKQPCLPDDLVFM